MGYGTAGRAGPPAGLWGVVAGHPAIRRERGPDPGGSRPDAERAGRAAREALDGLYSARVLAGGGNYWHLPALHGGYEWRDACLAGTHTA